MKLTIEISDDDIKNLMNMQMTVEDMEETMEGRIACAICRSIRRQEMIKDCRYCTHSDAISPEDTEVKCYADIGEYVDNPKCAEGCPDFIYDDYFPKW